MLLDAIKQLWKRHEYMGKTCSVNWFDLTLVTSLTTLLVSTPAHILLWEMFAEKVFLRSDFEIKFRIFGSIISISLSLASQLFNAAATLPVMAEFHQSSKIHICFTQLKCNIFFLWWLPTGLRMLLHKFKAHTTQSVPSLIYSTLIATGCPKIVLLWLADFKGSMNHFNPMSRKPKNHTC